MIKIMMVTIMMLIVIAAVIMYILQGLYSVVYGLLLITNVMITTKMELRTNKICNCAKCYMAFVDVDRRFKHVDDNGNNGGDVVYFCIR